MHYPSIISHLLQIVVYISVGDRDKSGTGAFPNFGNFPNLPNFSKFSLINCSGHHSRRDHNMDHKVVRMFRNDRPMNRMDHSVGDTDMGGNGAKGLRRMKMYISN